MEERLPALARSRTSVAAVVSACGAAAGFAKGVERLAAGFKAASTEHEQAFTEFLGLKDVHEDIRLVGGQCLAWHEAGEAQATLATRLLSVASSLRRTAERGEADTVRSQGEVSQLTRALAEAEVSHQLSIEVPSTQLGRLLSARRRAQEPSEAERRQLLDGQWNATGVALEQLVMRLEAVRLRSCAAFNEAAAEVRTLAQGLGEQLSTLQPTTRKGGVSQRLEGLIKSMSTAEGRQKLRDAEAAEAALQPPEDSPCCAPEDQMVSPPAESCGEGGWRVRGVYEYQVLKAGLRHLDSTWPVDNLLSFPQGKDGHTALFRERLLQNLLEGTLKLQSVTNNDVSAAQRDLDRLSLRQLLRLRVHHLDFTPSGCGADTVTAVGGVHEAFLSKLDGLLFRQLGQKALGHLEQEEWGGPLLEREAHRLGRQAVLMSCVAQSVPEPPWWCWWLTGEQRVFFNAETFTSAGGFPSGGVLEILELSKPDKHEPTGQLIWFDWRVDRVLAEANLSAGNRKTQEGPSSTDDVTGSTPPRLSSRGSLASATGAATAAMVSPGMLHDRKSSLRKTGSLKE